MQKQFKIPETLQNLMRRWWHKGRVARPRTADPVLAAPEFSRCLVVAAPLAQQHGVDFRKQPQRKREPFPESAQAMVSALTLFGLDEMLARYASYADLAEIIRHRFQAPRQTLRELFGRLVFNVLCGNTDDHARNHAAFWDGKSLSLTPAYDICPQNRTGNEASQAMKIVGDKRLSRLAICLEAAPNFLLDMDTATAIIERQIGTIRAKWDAVCDEAMLSPVDRKLLGRRIFLNPVIFEGAPNGLRTSAE